MEEIRAFLRGKAGVAEPQHWALGGDDSLSSVKERLIDVFGGPPEQPTFVLLTGNEGVMHELGQMLRQVEWMPLNEAPRLVIITDNHFFTYCRREVDTIPASFKRWYAKHREGEKAACVVCMEEAPGYVASCAACESDTCVDCFIRTVRPRAAGGVTKVFRCPHCRAETLAADALHVRSPAPDAAEVPVWGAIRGVLEGYGGKRATLVVASHPCLAVIDARVGPNGRVILMGAPETRDAAQRLIPRQGTVIGVGRLPRVMTPGHVPDAERGRAFMVIPGARALEIPEGWKYVVGVLL